MKFKKILKYILFLLPWFLSSILSSSKYNYYNSLNLPFFALPKWAFPIIWTLLYILISISISIIYSMYQPKYIKDYNKSLISHYIFNELFTYVLFVFKNLFFSFIIALSNLITSLFLYYETKSLDESSSKFLLPYVYFNVFATILSLTIYFINL